MTDDRMEYPLPNDNLFSAGVSMHYYEGKEDQ